MPDKSNLVGLYSGDAVGNSVVWLREKVDQGNVSSVVVMLYNDDGLIVGTFAMPPIDQLWAAEYLRLQSIENYEVEEL